MATMMMNSQRCALDISLNECFLHFLLRRSNILLTDKRRNLRICLQPEAWCAFLGEELSKEKQVYVSSQYARQTAGQV